MVEMKLRIYLLLAWKDKDEVHGLIPTSFTEHMSLFLSLFALIGKSNQENWNSTGFTFFFRSSCSRQVLPCGAECASSPSPGWWDSEDLLCCPVLAEVALPHTPLAKVLMLRVCTDQRGEKPVAAGGAQGNFVPGTGLLGCWKGSGGIRRGGRDKGR